MSGDLFDGAVRRAAARYRRVGRAAEGWARGKLTADPAFAAIIDHLSPEVGGLMDVGCGEAYLLALVRELRPEIGLVGYDHDARRIDHGRKALWGESRVELVAADVREVELPAADVITCLDVLHYLAPDAQDALLGRLARAVNPGGVLLVRDGVQGAGVRSWLTSLSERLLVAVGRHKGDGVFLRPAGELRESLARTGLEPEVVPCAEGTPFSNVLLVGRRR